MAKRKKYDFSSPETGKLRNSIIHGTFVSEGSMVAFPLCFPGASSPIVADESHITALDVSADGMIYGGTSGYRTHLFVGMFHGVTGAVLDMGIVKGANHCAAICCGNGKFIACANGANGSQIVRRGLQGLPFDLLQEWGFSRPPYEYLDNPVADERIIHAVASHSGQKAFILTENHLLSVDITDGEIGVLCELRGMSRIALDPEGSVIGLDTDNALWRYESVTGHLHRNAVRLPDGAWYDRSLIWASDRASGGLYVADNDGRLFYLDDSGRFSQRLGQTPLAPVTTMAVTFDGRLFGTCGEGMSHLFCYDPKAGEISDIGIAVSFFERRRYGYEFGDAVVGRDGQIIFGEDDDLGHLWLYFPRIKPHS